MDCLLFLSSSSHKNAQLYFARQEDSRRVAPIGWRHAETRRTRCRPTLVDLHADGAGAAPPFEAELPPRRRVNAFRPLIACAARRSTTSRERTSIAMGEAISVRVGS